MSLSQPNQIPKNTNCNQNNFLSQPNPVSFSPPMKKKRKSNSPTIQSPIHEPLFPFSFGPSQPLPINSNKPNYACLETKKSSIASNLSIFIVDFLNKILSSNNRQPIDIKLITSSIEQVLEDTLKNQ
uniref:Uncharacterized protein LOC114347961 n=1 Tax=Diabrotica virgifera virgifera TaxID=50390 RepID=A0A6P7H774_DIAVI